MKTHILGYMFSKMGKGDDKNSGLTPYRLEVKGNLMDVNIIEPVKVKLEEVSE